MTSKRVPGAEPPNAWTARLAARRAARLPVADLAAFDPTRTGLSPLPEAAAALAAVGPLAYEPDPRGAFAARAAVAGYFAARGLQVSPEVVLLTSSTSESYAHLLRLLADPGEAVAVPAPSYPLFEPLARAEGVEVRPYTLRYDGAWHLDRGSLEAALRGARAAITVEPNHPTGSSLAADDRAFLAAAAASAGAAIVADEVFGDHAWPGADPPVSWLAAESPVPTFVLGGLSKLCGLPHLKLGWLVAAGPPAPRAAALTALEWLADLYLSVGAPVQAALPALLELRHGFAARVRTRVGENLARWDALAAARPALTRLRASAGWSVVLRVPAERSAEAWALELLDRGVALHPGDFYDLGGGEHLVASLLADPADTAAACAALSELLLPR